MEKIKKKILKYENFFFFLFFIIILFNSLNLKTKFTTKIYTEYDDIGVIALHKGSVGDIKISVFNKEYQVKEETIKNLNQTLLFPLYISHGWTYSPGQYLVLPFLNLDKKNYENKIKITRYISVVTALICSLIIFFVCINLLRINKWLSLLVFCIFSFSLNLNIYSNHMSPYMMYALCSTLGVIICFKSINTKNPLTYYTFNSILIYFSYMNILFYLCFLFIELRKRNLLYFINDVFKNRKKILLLNFFLILPLIFIIQVNVNELFKAGDRGISIDYNLNFFEILKFLFAQFTLSINSIQTGFFPIFFSNYNSYFLILLIAISIYSIGKFDTYEKILFETLCVYFFIWILLFLFGRLPLDQTRHSLIFFPAYLFIIALIFKKIKKINFLSIFLLILLIIPSISLNDKILKSKKSIFDYELISNLNIKTIYTYSDTLSPLLYYGNKFKVKNTDLNSFRNNFDVKNSPKQLLLVSQNQKFSNRVKYDIFLKNLKKNYTIEILKEINTNVYMPYNNYRHQSTENGFYLYLLNKKI